MNLISNTCTALVLGLCASGALAQTLISHTKAINGNVSPGDSPGYPITLSAAGAYKLTSNLIVPAGTAGISITAKHVTLDLNGFSISGGGSCDQNWQLLVTCTQPFHDGSGAVGIHVPAYFATVRNGSVRGFAGDGMLVNRSTTIEAMHVSENAGSGIETTTSTYNTLRISNVFVFLNRVSGIDVDTSANIDNARVEKNGADGISGTDEVLVVNSISRLNKWRGLRSVAARSTLVNGNGMANRINVISLGSNLDDGVPY